MESTTIQSETRQGKPIPVIRSNRHDINRMMGIFAAINEFELWKRKWKIAFGRFRTVGGTCG